MDKFQVKLSPTFHLVTLDLASHIPPSEEALDSTVKSTLYIVVYINTMLE